jgi:hypothetical protein
VDAVVSIYGRTAPFIAQRVPRAKIRKARKEAAERARLEAVGEFTGKRPTAAPARLPTGYSARLQARAKLRETRISGEEERTDENLLIDPRP